MMQNKPNKELNKILVQGISDIGLDTGIVSCIVEDSYVVYVSESAGDGIEAGTEFELADTYCADVINENCTKYYKDVAKITELLKHPCYLNTQLRGYIGTPIVVNGKVWGTLNYSSLSPRKLEYSKEEVEFLEGQAKSVAAIVAAMQDE